MSSAIAFVFPSRFRRDVILSISLDHGAISDANDPVTKRHRPFKHVSDWVILLLSSSNLL
jgi:hypothetical protein